MAASQHIVPTQSDAAPLHDRHRAAHAVCTGQVAPERALGREWPPLERAPGGWRGQRAGLSIAAMALSSCPPTILSRIGWLLGSSPQMGTCDHRFRAPSIPVLPADDPLARQSPPRPPTILFTESIHEKYPHVAIASLSSGPSKCTHLRAHKWSLAPRPGCSGEAGGGAEEFAADAIEGSTVGRSLDCRRSDLVQQFLLGRTELLLQHGWDDTLKNNDHYDAMLSMRQAGALRRTVRACGGAVAAYTDRVERMEGQCVGPRRRSVVSRNSAMVRNCARSCVL